MAEAVRFGATPAGIALFLTNLIYASHKLEKTREKEGENYL